MVAHRRRASVTSSCACSQAAAQYRCGTSLGPRRFHARFNGELTRMNITRSFRTLILGCGVAAIAGCQTAPPPPPMVVPASFTPLGVTAPYLMGDVIGGLKARSAKMKAAKIRPLGPSEAPAYMTELGSELRRQTAGIGLDVLQVGGGIVVRIPAAFTFDAGS